MALQIAFTDDKDNDYAAAYARIEEINAHYQRKTARVVVEIYKTKAAMNREKRPVGSVAYDLQADATDIMPAYDAVFGQALFDASKTDPRKLGYVWLKTLPLFSGGLDV